MKKILAAISISLFLNTAFAEIQNTSLNENMLLAAKGDAKAQYNLGNAYYSGEGVPQDYATSAYWLRKAADQGDAKAQYNLAVIYYNGEGVPINRTIAKKWLTKSANQGLTQAKNFLDELN